MRDELIMIASPCASTSTVTTSGHELTLFHDMDGLLATLEREVDGARERVWIETYIYRHDAKWSRAPWKLTHK